MLILRLYLVTHFTFKPVIVILAHILWWQVHVASSHPVVLTLVVISGTVWQLAGNLATKQILTSSDAHAVFTKPAQSVVVIA